MMFKTLSSHCLLLAALLLSSCAVFDEFAAEFEASAAPCTATAFQDASLYTSPFDYGPEEHVITMVAAGQTLDVTSYMEYGWYQAADGWLWLDDGWTLSGGCTALLQGGYDFALPDPHQCYYFPVGIAGPQSAYMDPRTEAWEFMTYLEDRFYPVVTRSEIWYEIVLEQGQTGWVVSGPRNLHGDCTALATVQMRPTPPEGICTIYLEPRDDFEYSVYSLPDRDSEVVAVMPQGEYVTVEAFTGGDEGYRVRLTDGTSGWFMETISYLLGSSHVLNGPCGDVPIELPGTE
jgi:hypothetical protein